MLSAEVNSKQQPSQRRTPVDRSLWPDGSTSRTPWRRGRFLTSRPQQKSCPWQGMIVTARRRNGSPGQTTLGCSNLAMTFSVAFKSRVAPMSPTTQQVQHSPNRRIKSMPFVQMQHIKVIYFWPANLACMRNRRVKRLIRSWRGGIGSSILKRPRSTFSVSRTSSVLA